MLRRAVFLLLSVGSLWGCTASVSHNAAVRNAFQEREAAYTKLANAMTAYCAAKHPTLEARQNCVVEKRLELLHLRQVNEEASDQLSTVPTQQSTYRENDSAPSVRCERARGQTTCQRLSRSFAEHRGG
jgi:hypothetical protein